MTILLLSLYLAWKYRHFLNAVAETFIAVNISIKAYSGNEYLDWRFFILFISFIYFIIAPSKLERGAVIREIVLCPYSIYCSWVQISFGRRLFLYTIFRKYYFSLARFYNSKRVYFWFIKVARIIGKVEYDFCILCEYSNILRSEKNDE